MDAAFLHYYLSSSSRTFVGQVVNLRPRPEGTRNRLGERSSPAWATTKLVLAMADGDTPDAIIQLDGPLPGPPQPGTSVAFIGVAQALTFDPYTVTFSVDRSYLRGWPEHLQTPEHSP